MLPAIGRERAKRLYQMGTVVGTGARLALGSDWPISSADPFLGMMVGVTRKNPKKPRFPVWEPDERVPLDTLLMAYTLGGAWINGSEKETGSLEPGKAADFIIVDRDILAVAIEQVGATQVLSTYVDGKRVFQRPPGAPAKSVDVGKLPHSLCACRGHQPGLRLRSFPAGASLAQLPTPRP